MKNGHSESSGLPDRIRLTARRTSIGTGVENSVQLSHHEQPNVVSQYHAEISVIKGVHFIVDRGSKVGTYVNKKKNRGQRKRALCHGDHVTFGPNTIVGEAACKVANCYTYVYQRVPPTNSSVQAEMTCSVCMGYFTNPVSIVPSVRAHVLSRLYWGLDAIV